MTSATMTSATITPFAASTTPPHAKRPTLRLTRRGRLLVTLLLMGALVVIGSLVGHTATASAGPRVAVRHVTVRPGETLWTLAERVAPSADPRITVARLESLNHLSGDEVDAGQRLAVSGV